MPESPSLLTLTLGQGWINTDKFLFFVFLFFQEEPCCADDKVPRQPEHETLGQVSTQGHVSFSS